MEIGRSQSSTQSLSSTIRDYVYENGRRYHRYAEGKYISPNDELEQDRLDLAHYLSLLVLNGNLFTAPLPPDPHHILDCGTGTGIWAFDIADKFKSARVVGVDLSPIQPPWVPPNCVFEVDDLSVDWSYPMVTATSRSRSLPPAARRNLTRVRAGPLRLHPLP